ncbi:MAG: hypothetical protein WC551_03380 [Patescibacteria group bacterium]
MDIAPNIVQELEKVTAESTWNPQFGAMIVKDGHVLASGFAYKPLNKQQLADHPLLGIHAEEAALMSALKNGVDIRDADLYLMGRREDGSVRYSDHSYCCVVCSRLLLQSGVSGIVHPAAQSWVRISPAEMFEQAIQRVRDGRV